MGRGAEPALADVAEQAQLGVAVHKPARADVPRQERLIELFPRVFLARCVAAQAEPEALSQRVLVFAAPPHGEAHARFRQVFRVAAEGQAAYIDGVRVRGGADVGARRHGAADIHRPAPPGPYQGEEAPDIGSHLRRRLPGQHPLEVAARQAVLPLEEERARQLQADPHEAGPADQYLAQGRNGLVQERLSVLFGDARPLRCLGRRQAPEEEDVGASRMGLGQGAEDGQGLVEPAAFDQLPGLFHAGDGGWPTRNLFGGVRRSYYKWGK